MERESEYLLHLMGAYLHGEKPDESPDVNWEVLVKLAHIHSVAGILGYMSMAYPICPDEQTRQTLRQICRHTVALFSRRGELADRFSAVLEEQGIDHILMKGCVVRHYYPVPELRTYGDTDIVIRPEDQERCHELMLSLGFKPKVDWGPIYSYTRGEEFYEIHTEIMEVNVSERADYREYFRNAWQHTISVGYHRYHFKPEYHFLYMLTHIAKHVVGSGAGVRMYLDIAAVIGYFGSAMDWNWIAGELDALHLRQFANVVLLFVQEYFGVNSPIPLMPAEEGVLQSFVEYTMVGGIFGKSGQDSGVNSLKSKSRGKKKISRVATLSQRLFPSAKTIESRYTYLQDKPWLLPAAWVHRLFKTRDSWPEHRQEAQNIMTADKETVRRIQKMYLDIGL